ncbi:MAG: galactose-1-epimerase, partial [Pseudomonadota bacterium]
RRALRPVARLSHSVIGISLSVATTEPGLQVYTGDAIDAGLIGLDQITYGPRSGLALETQVWPDAPNRPDFPSAFLAAGDVLHQETVYQFRLR